MWHDSRLVVPHHRNGVTMQNISPYVSVDPTSACGTSWVYPPVNTSTKRTSETHQIGFWRAGSVSITFHTTDSTTSASFPSLVMSTIVVPPLIFKMGAPCWLPIFCLACDQSVDVIEMQVEVNAKPLHLFLLALPNVRFRFCSTNWFEPALSDRHTRCTFRDAAIYLPFRSPRLRIVAV